MANMKKEQNSEPVIAKVIKWMETESAPTENIYSTEEHKYLKQLWRIFTENGILYRQYFAHDCKMLYKQLFVPKAMLKEVVYRKHNAPTGGHLGITKTTEDFRKRFYCPNYVELVAD